MTGSPLILSQKALVFMCLQYKSFKNTVEKGEIAHLENFLPFSINLKLSAKSLSLEESKILCLGKG